MAFKLGSENRRDGTHHNRSAMKINPFAGISRAIKTVTGKRRVGGDRRRGSLWGLLGRKIDRQRLLDEQNGVETLHGNNYGEIHRESLDEGTIAEANMDGTISVEPDVDLDSAFGKRVIKHEKEHLRQISSGEAAYDDNWVMWKGKLYIRQNGYIHGPNGKFPEGYAEKKDGEWIGHPWEIEAIKAEKNT